MKQISYKLLGCLVKKHNHIRGLAREIGTNQMSISRCVKELEEKNILDFRQEGKNKVYFIKDTIEAEEAIKMMEHAKLMGLIAEDGRLRRIAKIIRENSKVGLAILFGSYAKGTESKNSDIDIYLESEDRKVKKELSMIDSKISVKLGPFARDNLLIKEIIKNHIIIKGVDRYYELVR